MQLELVTTKHKNGMVDAYYQMRELDRSLQLFHDYEN